MHLLIPYVNLYNHPDPLFDEYTYGEGDSRAKKLKNDVKKGDYVFFHTSKRGKKYGTITQKKATRCKALINLQIWILINSLGF